MNVLRQFAENITISPSGDLGIQDAPTNADALVTNVLNVAYLWGGIVCVLIIVVAGYFYVTSNGNAANIKRAKDGIMGAIIGLVVILLAFTATQFIIGRF